MCSLFTVHKNFQAKAWDDAALRIADILFCHWLTCDVGVLLTNVVKLNKNWISSSSLTRLSLCSFHILFVFTKQDNEKYLANDLCLQRVDNNSVTLKVSWTFDSALSNIWQRCGSGRVYWLSLGRTYTSQESTYVACQSALRLSVELSVCRKTRCILNALGIRCRWKLSSTVVGSL